MKPTDVIETSPDCTTYIKNHVSLIETEISHMARLIQDLLLLSSIDAGNWIFHQSKINVDTILISLYEKFEITCHKKSIDLQIEMPEEYIPPLFSDEDRLNQIISIFLDNAISYSPEQSSILMKAFIKKNNLAISVIDYEIGISEEDKKHIGSSKYCFSFVFILIKKSFIVYVSKYLFVFYILFLVEKSPHSHYNKTVYRLSSKALKPQRNKQVITKTVMNMKNRKKALKSRKKQWRWKLLGYISKDSVCPDCGEKSLILFDRYDAWACMSCLEWLDDVYGEPGCPYCSMRPPTPYDAYELEYINGEPASLKKRWRCDNYQHKAGGMARHEARRQQHFIWKESRELLPRP